MQHEKSLVSDRNLQNVRILLSDKLDESHGQEEREKLCQAMLSFVQWYGQTPIGHKVPITTRDLVGWVAFINGCPEQLSFVDRLVHGACLVIFDGLGTFLTQSALEETKAAAVNFFR